MSILIKGMDMPKNCGDCPFCIFSADEKRWIGYCNTSDEDYYCKVLDRFMEYDKVDGGVDILGKPEDCPLIEIPTPHGDLIDIEEVDMSLSAHVTLTNDADEDWKHIYEAIEAVQTVIESEE